MKVKIGTLSIGEWFMTALTGRLGKVVLHAGPDACEVTVLLSTPAEHKVLHPDVLVCVVRPEDTAAQ